MKSRALNLAALALLAGILGSSDTVVRPAAAQALDANKPPAQIFAGTCAACHRSPRGLVRSVAPGSLPSFLRQHYTTGNDMASTMASFVLGNGGTQQVAEPPKREPKQDPKHDAKQRAKDGQEVAARTPDAKELSKSAKQQKGSKKGAAEPAAAPAPEPEAAKPETPVEPAKPEVANTDCKVEPPKQTDEAKPGFTIPQPSTPGFTMAQPSSSSPSPPPRQPASLLTLPGFPAPEPEPEPAATNGGCEPAASTAATRAEAPTAEQVKEQPKEQVKEQPKEQAKEQPTVAPPPTLAEAPKAEPARAAVTEAAPTLDIMREEVHAPRLVRPSQKKRAAPPPQ